MIGLVAVVALTAFCLGVMYGTADKRVEEKENTVEMAQR